MVLRNSRSIQKHRTGCEFSYCDKREAGCAFAWRSHVTKSCLSWDISDVTSCNALTSHFGTYLTSRRVTLWSHVFTSRPPAIRHTHVNMPLWLGADNEIATLITLDILTPFTNEHRPLRLNHWFVNLLLEQTAYTSVATCSYPLTDATLLASVLT